MKNAILGVLLLAICASVAFGADKVAHPYGRGAPSFMKAGDWRQMTYFLPGGYAFIDRLELTKDQEKVLDEICKEWSDKSQQAHAAMMQQMPALAKGDYQDAEKMKAYWAKYAEASQKAAVATPVEQVSNVLTPDQLGKVLEADKLLTEWSRWATEHMAGYEKKLDEIFGIQKKATGFQLYPLQTVLNDYQRGAGQLAGRLGLTKEQEDALRALSMTPFGDMGARTATLGAALRVTKTPQDETAAITAAVQQQIWAQTAQLRREQIEKILTPGQRDNIAKALPILEERNKLLVEKYLELEPKMTAVLPPRKTKSGAPVGGAGGGMPYPYPGWKPQ